MNYTVYSVVEKPTNTNSRLTDGSNKIIMFCACTHSLTHSRMHFVSGECSYSEATSLVRKLRSMTGVYLDLALDALSTSSDLGGEV